MHSTYLKDGMPHIVYCQDSLEYPAHRVTASALGL